MMEALKVTREILDLPALLLADLFAFDAATRASPLLGAQLINMRRDRQVLEVRQMTAPLAPFYRERYVKAIRCAVIFL